MKTETLKKNSSKKVKNKKDIKSNNLQAVTWRPPPCCGVGLEMVFDSPKEKQKTTRKD